MQTFSKRSERLSASLGEEKDTISNTNIKGRPISSKTKCNKKVVLAERKLNFSTPKCEFFKQVF